MMLQFGFLLVASVLWKSPIGVDGVLLFPPASVYQITASFSAPIEIPDRKLYLDWGFQMNYDLPYSPAQFTSVPIWPFKNKRDLGSTSNGSFIPEQLPDKYDVSSQSVGGRHPSDFTAGELYRSFENLLVSYGFHETCLLRSVCELARHPFADEQKNILTEILTFLLTPSLNEAFDDTEHEYRFVYEEAERNGFLAADCRSLYYECEQDFLSGITKIVFENMI